MNREWIEADQLEQLFLDQVPLIDVRAPVEFNQGSLPHSNNIPILEDAERALVGTEYKKSGNESAVRLGQKLVSGEVKEARIQKWKLFFKENPSAMLYCFRGGQRSQISQMWLHEVGFDIPRLRGGYKVARQFLVDRLHQFSESNDFLPLAGPTGSGKTILISEVHDHYPSLDLEGLARHRGSAFGAMSEPQPSQIDFENTLSLEVMKLDARAQSKILPLVEDESRLIGKCVLPGILFEKINTSPALLIEERLEVRVENIFDDYILKSAIVGGDEISALQIFAKYQKSLLAISKKLGGSRTQEILEILKACETEYLKTRRIETNRHWIEKLLVYYYDPLYLSSLERRQIKFVFKGTRKECFNFLISKGNK